MLNHIVVMGRLTRDPELRTTQSGVNVASFTVAVDRDFGGRDGAERQTDFFDCAAWRQTGEFVSKYFQKGRMIVVSGRMQSRKYQDREGNNRTAWEIQADTSISVTASVTAITQVTASPATPVSPVTAGAAIRPARARPFRRSLPARLRNWKTTVNCRSDLTKI